MKKKTRTLLLSSLFIIVVMLASYGLFLFFLVANRPVIDFFDIGQGDSILIRQGWREVLIDGGPDRSVLQP